ncbi:glycine betaine ABC transporter substrate-binding protein [Streptomyces roseochromogenus]|uniref:ABC-type glycine betaine transport system substrate-binding domain-containing protein n=1 Tax=Streptomyces roseochromogenus subsp. oscitans DS 12.976 TaxID=1352936 RepID=V6KU41_STRRC|nr:glycine betaine ABC transporter substrate-binding protein [Streptomyces roseochromogenus]EST35670.1 hypothetical protein M878_04670 [Streptomyces roseochromogenus subsp. oscitans DS 12.976]
MTAPPDDCQRATWGRICGAYLTTRRQIVLDAVVQHLQLTTLSVLVGLAIALPLAVLARRWGWAAGPVLAVTTILCTIPSLAMFSLFLPLYGLSATPRGLTVLPPGRAVDQNAFAVTASYARAHHLKTLSDLGAAKLRVRLAAGDECVQRPYCEPGLKRVYAIDVTGVDPKGVGTTQAKRAVQNGQDQMVLTTTTDATLDPAIRSPSRTASSMSCVTSSTVLRTAARIRRNSSCSCSRTNGSTVPGGTSRARSGQCGRLVHQQHRRIRRERPRHPDPPPVSERPGGTPSRCLPDSCSG